MGYWKSFCSWGLSYCVISCAVSAITAPILSYSGIPLALLAPIGTLIFTPLVTAILIISGTLWCMLLCSLPGMAACVYLLEKISLVWHWLLTCAPTGYTIPLPAIPSASLAPLVMSICAISFLANRYSTVIRIGIYCACIIGVYSIGRLTLPPHARIPLIHSEKIVCVRAHDFTAIIDGGGCAIRNPEQWALYTVVRTLTLQGKHSAHALIIARATEGTLRRARILVKNNLVHAVIIQSSGIHSRRVTAFAQEMAACSIPCIIDDLPSR